MQVEVTWTKPGEKRLLGTTGVTKFQQVWSVYSVEQADGLREVIDELARLFKQSSTWDFEAVVIEETRRTIASSS